MHGHMNVKSVPGARNDDCLRLWLIC